MPPGSGISRSICWVSFNFKSNNTLLCPHSDGRAYFTPRNCLFVAENNFRFFYERPPNLMRRKRIPTEVKTKHKWKSFSDGCRGSQNKSNNEFQGFSSHHKNFIFVWISLFSCGAKARASHRISINYKREQFSNRSEDATHRAHVDVYLSKEIYDKRQAIQLT